LDRRARALGSAGLRAYLDGCYNDAAHSLPQLAAELGTSVWMVRAAMDTHGVLRLPGPDAKGRSRQVDSDRHATARAISLGFPDLCAYLQDRYAERAWPLPQLAVELGMGIRVVRRLLREHGVTRTRATAALAAAGARGRALQAAHHAERRQARLAALGFADLSGYLRVRRVEQGWPIERIGAELGVDRRWLRAQLTAHQLP
jgi:AraC-like DNA-binding protein